MSKGRVTGQVNAGCMLFAHRDCTPQQQEDSADCVLYAQLAATRKHDRFGDTARWNEVCLAALNRFGWATKNTESLSLSAVELGVNTLLGWLSGYLPPSVSRELFYESQELAKRSFLSFADQPAVGLLAQQVLQSVPQVDQPQPQCHQKIVLQLGMLAPNTNLSLMTLTCTSRKPLTPVFPFEMLALDDLVGNVEMRFYALQMIDAIYAPLRTSIQEALKDRRAGLCHALEDIEHEQ